MEMIQPATPSTSSSPRRLPLFLGGVLLFLLGPAIYFARFRLGFLDLPWYAPILATMGVFLMVGSIWQRRGIWRSAGLAMGLLVCGGEWFVLVASKVPAYVGPAEPGNKVPAFTTRLADGSTFTHKDLDRGGASLLLFFRGRW